MTSKKLFSYFFAQYVILALLKLWFFNYTIFSNAGFQEIVFWIIVVITGAALVRRFGVINFFESFFIIFVWLVGDLLLDLLVTSRFTVTSIFATREYWTAVLLLALSVFLFHKKRHIQVRHELHAKAHAAAHPHEHHKPH
jgi:hypothetical protein